MMDGRPSVLLEALSGDGEAIAKVVCLGSLSVTRVRGTVTYHNTQLLSIKVSQEH